MTFCFCLPIDAFKSCRHNTFWFELLSFSFPPSLSLCLFVSPKKNTINSQLSHCELNSYIKLLTRSKHIFSPYTLRIRYMYVFFTNQINMTDKHSSFRPVFYWFMASFIYIVGLLSPLDLFASFFALQNCAINMQICCQKKERGTNNSWPRSVTHKNALSFGKESQAAQQRRARNTPCTLQSLCNWPQIT